MLESLLMIIIALPIIFVVGYFYRKSDKYKEDLKDEKLKKEDKTENENLENFIELLEKEKSKEK